MVCLNLFQTFIIFCLPLVFGLNFLSYEDAKVSEKGRNMPIRVDLAVTGRSTYNDSFEVGEPIKMLALLKNISGEPVIVDTYFKTDIVTIVIQNPRGEIVVIDPYERKQRHYEEVIGKTLLRIPKRAIDFKELKPGQSVSLSDIPVLWEGVSWTLDFTLPKKVLDQPGEYRVEVFYRAKESKEFANVQVWTGEIRSNSQKIWILNNDELARLEASFSIKREEAFRIARSAAIRHFSNKSPVEVYEPIRLRIHNKKGWYDISFVYDSGLKASWVRVIVDASTGKATINPFGKGA